MIAPDDIAPELSPCGLHVRSSPVAKCFACFAVIDDAAPDGALVKKYRAREAHRVVSVLGSNAAREARTPEQKRHVVPKAGAR